MAPRVAPAEEVLVGLVLIVGMAALVVGVLVGIRVAASGERALADVRPDANHRNLARLVERLLRDDLVRPAIPAAEREVAAELLREYWGDAPELP